MSKCLMCSNAVENEASTGVLCRSCYDAEHGASDAARTSFLSKIPTALLVACAPFVMKFRTTSSASMFTLDLGTTHWEVHAIDYFALVLGPIAVALGVLEAWRASARADEGRLRAGGFAVAAIVVGAYQTYGAFN